MASAALVYAKTESVCTSSCGSGRCPDWNTVNGREGDRNTTGFAAGGSPCVISRDKYSGNPSPLRSCGVAVNRTCFTLTAPVFAVMFTCMCEPSGQLCGIVQKV